jgi:hypothetical protein
MPRKPPRPTPFFKPQEWYQLFYLGLGHKRSIDLLHSQVRIFFPDKKHPSVETMRDWCKHGKWVTLAEIYDKEGIRMPPREASSPEDYTPLDTAEMMEMLCRLVLTTATRAIGLMDKQMEAPTLHDISNLMLIGEMCLSIRLKMRALREDLPDFLPETTKQAPNKLRRHMREHGHYMSFTQPVHPSMEEMMRQADE